MTTEITIRPPTGRDLSDLTLLCDVQYLEQFGSDALNRKLTHILPGGIYKGFDYQLAGGRTCTISSAAGSAALVHTASNHLLAIRQQNPITVTLPAGVKSAIVIDAVYALGTITKQVDMDATQHAADVLVVPSANVTADQLVIVEFDVPAGASTLTGAMVDLSRRQSKTVADIADVNAVLAALTAHQNAASGHTKDQVGLGSLQNWSYSHSYTDATGGATRYATGKAVADAYNALSSAKLNASSYTAADVLAKLKTVDGTGSGLDADLFDGVQRSVMEADLKSYTDTQIANLVASSPAALDTLNELAAALGNDPNFATTMTDLIGTKLNASSYTAADVLAKLKTVDGAGSGLDADLLDGQSGSYYQNASNLNAGTVPDARISGSYTGLVNLTGSGTVDFSKFLGNAADSVSAPSFSWTGDTNTGIYQPGADQLAITTGGVQRALFNSSGISGVGTGLTALNASNLGSGTVPNARLPTTATRWPTFAEVTDKPATYPPDSHTHDDRYYTKTQGDGRYAAIERDIKNATALDTSDLDTIQSRGFYYQSANANATVARHYPTARAGTLMVTTAAGVVQTYIPYGAPDQIYIRGYYGTTWSAWAATYSTLAKPDKTDVGLPSLQNWSYSHSYTDATGGATLYATGKAVADAYNALNSAKLNASSYTAADVLAKLKTVDGTGSGLDADLFDGKQRSTMESELKGYTDTQIANLVASSPAALDTLNELAAALGNDPNFATTMTDLIGTKLNASSYTAADVLAKLKTVDGAGSGLDADLLDGVGLTDASVANTVVKRNGSGDINARLFRSEYATTNATINYIMTQIDQASNNYLRPSTPAQFRAGVTDGYYLPVGGKAADADLLDGQDSSYYLSASNLNAGTVPNARISGSYTGLVNLTGSGTVDFSKFLGNAADSVSAPSFSWTGDTNTGIYQPGADQLAITTGGVQRALFNSSGISGVGTGLTALNASNLGSGTVPDARISGSYTGLVNLTGSGTVDFSKFLGNAADSVSAPSFSWTGDTNTGIYQPGADQLAITTGGVQRALFNSSGISGVGTGLTALNASNLGSGTVPNARLPTTATRWPTWSEVTGKPELYTPTGEAFADGSGWAVIGSITTPQGVKPLIKQWGITAGVYQADANYPIAFSTALCSFSGASLNDSNQPGETFAVSAVGGGNGTMPGLSSARITQYLASSTSSHRVYWEAIGY